MTKHTRTKVPAGTTHIINASTGEVKELKNNHIQKMALDNGFKLKEQPNGKMELNPYVYDFANALTDQLKLENDELKRKNVLLSSFAVKVRMECLKNMNIEAYKDFSFFELTHDFANRIIEQAK